MYLSIYKKYIFSILHHNMLFYIHDMYVYTCKSLFHFHANAIIFLFDFCVVFLNRSSGTLLFFFIFF